MTSFATDSAPVNLYGDTADVLIINNWQSGYAKYLADNGLVLDAAGNPVKGEIENV